MIEFGEYLPDQASFENPGATTATNCLPHAKGYTGMPSAVVFSDALTARARGAIACRDKDGNVNNYAGDATKLYSLSDTAWGDVSSATYTTGGDESWEFIKWGEKVIATNFSDVPQVITLGGANFADLAGTPPQARHIAAVRDFVVFGNTYDGVDGNKPFRVRWSGINDEESWTVSASTQADYQDLLGDGGWVQKVVGGEYGVVFQERSIWRMTYVGSPAIFQFDEVAPGYGTPAPNSVTQIGDAIFFLGQDGFYVLLNGQQVQPIGDQKVDDTFWADVADDYLERVVAAVDPVKKIVFWAYAGSGHTNGDPNKILCFDWSLNRWSIIEQDVEWLFTAASAGYTLDTLDTVSTDIDALAFSLDSRVWTGGNIVLGAFDTDNKLNFFTGTDMNATLETPEIELSPGQRSFVRSVRPMVDGGTSTIQIGTRDLQSGSVSWGSAVSVNAAGDCPIRSSARYHRARVNVTGDFNHALGVDALFSPSGTR